MDQHAARLAQRSATIAALPQSELVGAIDDDAQDLLDAVAFGGARTHGEIYQRQRVRTQESAGATRTRRGPLGREDALQQVIGDRPAVAAVARELAERRPLRVFAPPRGIRLEPNGKSFCKVLARVCLRVPVAEMLYVAPAAGTCGVAVRIRLRGGAEH